MIAPGHACHKADNLAAIFRMIFLEIKLWNFSGNFIEIHSKKSKQQ